MEATLKSAKYDADCRRCGKPYHRGELFAHAGHGLGFHPRCCPYPLTNPEVLMDPLGPVTRLGERIGTALVEAVRRFGQGREVWEALKVGINRSLERNGMKVRW